MYSILVHVFEFACLLRNMSLDDHTTRAFKNHVISPRYVLEGEFRNAEKGHLVKTKVAYFSSDSTVPTT